MNPLLEINACSCFFVVGPQLTRDVPNSARLSYKSVIKSGDAFLERLGAGSGLRDLIPTEPQRAMKEVVKSLRKLGLYDEWLKETFSNYLQPCGTSKIPDSIQWLLELQKMGAMLACTQYDNILDRMAGTEPVSISCEDGAFMEWLARGEIGQEEETLPLTSTKIADNTHTRIEAGERNPSQLSRKTGFLHLHGVQTALNTLCLLPRACNEEESSVDGPYCSDSSILSNRWASLRNIFHKKQVFLVGFDEEHRDPLLSNLFKILYPPNEAKLPRNLPIFLSSSSSSAMPACFQCSEELEFLQLRVSSVDHLREVIVPAESNNFSVGKYIL